LAFLLINQPWRGAAPLMGSMLETQRKATPSPTVGGDGGVKFEDTVEAPHALVGFRVWSGDFAGHRVVHGIQPIYRTPSGQWYGKAHGRQTGTPREEVAPPGYAVGGLSAQTGQRVDGFILTFVPITGDRTQPKSHQQSGPLGGRTGNTFIGGGGRIAVGIHGRAGNELDAIGLLMEE
jgi:hypothetical protein